MLLAFSAISASSAFLRGRAFHLGCGGTKGSRAGFSVVPHESSGLGTGGAKQRAKGCFMGWWLGIGLAVLGVISVTAVPLAARWQRREAHHATRLFQQQRAQLQVTFLEMARSVGKPRGLRWLDCDWLDAVTFARDRQSQLLTAFAGVNIRFEAIEGGDMEDVAAVSTVRDAVAVFHFQNGAWGTGGKALFNMNPQEAIERLVAQFEPIAGGNAG